MVIAILFVSGCCCLTKEKEKKKRKKIAVVPSGTVGFHFSSARKSVLLSGFLALRRGKVLQQTRLGCYFLPPSLFLSLCLQSARGSRAGAHQNKLHRAGIFLC